MCYLGLGEKRESIITKVILNYCKKTENLLFVIDGIDSYMMKNIPC